MQLIAQAADVGFSDTLVRLLDELVQVAWLSETVVSCTVLLPLPYMHLTAIWPHLFTPVGFLTVEGPANTSSW